MEETKLTLDDIKNYNMFPRTRKAIEMIEETYKELCHCGWDTSAPELDQEKMPFIDHSMMYVAQALYDDNPGWAEDLYDYLGVLINEEKRKQRYIHK